MVSGRLRFLSAGLLCLHHCDRPIPPPARRRRYWRVCGERIRRRGTESSARTVRWSWLNTGGPHSRPKMRATSCRMFGSPSRNRWRGSTGPRVEPRFAVGSLRSRGTSWSIFFAANRFAQRRKGATRPTRVGRNCPKPSRTITRRPANRECRSHAAGTRSHPPRLRTADVSGVLGNLGRRAGGQRSRGRTGVIVGCCVPNEIEGAATSQTGVARLDSILMTPRPSYPKRFVSSLRVELR